MTRRRPAASKTPKRECGRPLSDSEMLKMKCHAIAVFVAASFLCTAASAESDQPTRMGSDKEKTVYVQLIVKACRAMEAPLEPINQGKVYDNEKPMTLDERKAALTATGCIDVPVPMDFLADAMSPNACMGHGGYLASMQFLKQRQDLHEFPAVGSWHCVVSDHEIVGASSM